MFVAEMSIDEKDMRKRKWWYATGYQAISDGCSGRMEQ